MSRGKVVGGNGGSVGVIVGVVFGSFIGCLLANVVGNFLGRKEVELMAVIYATLIIKGKRTFGSVPKVLKEQVRAILIDLELAELTEE